MIHYPNALENQVTKFNTSGFNQLNLQEDKGTLDGVSFFDTEIYKIREMNIEFRGISEVKFTPVTNLNLKIRLDGNSGFKARAIKEVKFKALFNSYSSFKTRVVTVKEPNRLQNNIYKFNRSAFNRININIEETGFFDGVSSFKANAIISAIGQVNFNSESKFKARAFKDTNANTVFEGYSTFKAKQMRIRNYVIKLNAYSSFIASATIIQIEYLTISGISFRPGDVIVIDLNNFFVTLNGVDITYKVDGNFFEFYAGENTLIWNDNVNLRKVKMEVLYQNKFL
jgi:hypothetical protein